jgi:hypothetical protein
MTPPIVLPDPCLSERLDPKDFEIANLAMAYCGGRSGPGAGEGARRKERDLVFDPTTAPWRLRRERASGG